MILVALAACAREEPAPPPLPYAPEGEAGGFLYAPFEGTASALQVYDHSHKEAEAPISAWGTALPANDFSKGHRGYDWYLLTGSPVFAAADGWVVSSGTRSPFRCGPLGRDVDDQLGVTIGHQSEDGRYWLTTYDHLSETYFGGGDRVVAGDVIGLSGESGCASIPHLHFGVKRWESGRGVRVDPYGWWGPAPDPAGRRHEWLWAEGEAPLLYESFQPEDPLALVAAVVHTGWDDASHPNNEQVVLHNRYWRWPRGCSLRNNEGDEHAIPAPSFVGPQTTVIYSGSGDPSAGVYFLGRDAGLWNDAGDCVHLVCGGQEIEEHATGDGTCSHDAWE